MSEPREHRVRAADGRLLLLAEHGDAAGPAVVFHHGTPGSRLAFSAVARPARDLGLRLILFDRPGYGGSDALPGRSVADVAADVAAIADALGIARLAVAGHSGGGPHALACAALLPDRVARAAACASVAPYGADGLDFLAGMGQENLDEFAVALEGRQPLERRHLASRAALAEASVEGMLELMDSLLSPPDREALTGELMRETLAHMTEGLRDGVQGWVDDDLAFCKPWGFELASIQVPVQVWQGEQDWFVPPTHGRWLAARIPGAEARLEAGEGHLSLLRRMPEILEWCRDGLV